VVVDAPPISATAANPMRDSHCSGPKYRASFSFMVCKIEWGLRFSNEQLIVPTYLVEYQIATGAFG
jgi:hypothetical protein